MPPMDAQIRVLVVDDNEGLRVVMSQTLEEEGFEVVEAASGEEALACFRQSPFQLVFTDIVMGEMSGIDLLKEVKELSPDTQVVVLTSYASLDTAISALRHGAYDYIPKPFEDPNLITAVANRAVDKFHLIIENHRLVNELQGKNQALENANHHLKEMVIRDGLTGLFNHRYFQESLNLEIMRSSRSQRHFSMIFLDIDHFKKYNDTHGHPEGDKLLRTFCQLLKEHMRESDLLARYGGEEFVALLPETPKQAALGLAEKIRRAIEDHPFPGRESQPLGRITVSIGVASFPENGRDGSSLLYSADQALYRAKHEGRNRVC